MDITPITAVIGAVRAAIVDLKFLLVSFADFTAII